MIGRSLNISWQTLGRESLKAFKQSNNVRHKIRTLICQLVECIGMGWDDKSKAIAHSQDSCEVTRCNRHGKGRETEPLGFGYFVLSSMFWICIFSTSIYTGKKTEAQII